jgi:hypothetical protein
MTGSIKGETLRYQFLCSADELRSRGNQKSERDREREREREIGV